MQSGSVKLKTYLNFLLSLRTVCSIVQRCVSRESTYVLRGKMLYSGQKKGRENYTYLFKEWLQTVELEYIAVPLHSPAKTTARQATFHM